LNNQYGAKYSKIVAHEVIVYTYERLIFVILSEFKQSTDWFWLIKIDAVWFLGIE